MKKQALQWGAFGLATALTGGVGYEIVAHNSLVPEWAANAAEGRPFDPGKMAVDQSLTQQVQRMQAGVVGVNAAVDAKHVRRGTGEVIQLPNKMGKVSKFVLTAAHVESTTSGICGDQRVQSINSKGAGINMTRRTPVEYKDKGDWSTKDYGGTDAAALQPGDKSALDALPAITPQKHVVIKPFEQVESVGYPPRSDGTQRRPDRDAPVTRMNMVLGMNPDGDTFDMISLRPGGAEAHTGLSGGPLFAASGYVGLVASTRYESAKDIQHEHGVRLEPGSYQVVVGQLVTEGEARQVYDQMHQAEPCTPSPFAP